MICIKKLLFTEKILLFICQISISTRGSPAKVKSFWLKLRVDVKRNGSCGWCGPFWVVGPDHNFRSKNYHFLFLLPFDAEAIETCKNTIQPTTKSSLLKLINYFSVSGDSQQNEILPQKKW